MKKESKNIINDWLDQHGNPEIERQVEKEAFLKKIINDLPSNQTMYEMSSEEWYSWFEEAYDEGFKAAKQKPRKKKEEVIEEGWVDFNKEKPKEENFYVTKVKGVKETIADWWGGYHFTYNDNLVTHWKRK